MFNQPFLLCSSFSFCNFNFDLRVYFLNILVDEFEKWERRKSLKNNEEERKLINDHFSATKLIVLGINEFLKSLMVMVWDLKIFVVFFLIFILIFFMFKLMISLLKVVEKWKTNSRTGDQRVKQEEISWSISNSQEKIMFNQPFLLCNSFSFCNFNFDIKVYFLNISVDEFEKWERRKSLKNNEEKRKLINDYFSATKLIVLGINEFLKSLMVIVFFFSINMLK